MTMKTNGKVHTIRVKEKKIIQETDTNTIKTNLQCQFDI